MKTEQLTIFIVDDNQMTREIVSRELQRKVNCKIRTFSSAEDCMHRMEDGLPDLILSDYYLDALYENRMNGDRMLAYIKRTYPSIPVIMYSSQNTVDLVLKLMRLGAADFIPKEDNFIKTISEKASAQIKKLKSEYEMKSISRLLLFLLIVFVGSMFLISNYYPDALPYFILGGPPILISIWALLINRKQDSSRQAEEARQG